MIALGWMNIGAAVAPDAALASIISTVLVIAGHQSIGAGIALAIPLAAAGQVLTIIVRTITVAFQHAADKAAENGNLTALPDPRFFPVPASDAYRDPCGYRGDFCRYQRSSGHAECDP